MKRPPRSQRAHRLGCGVEPEPGPAVHGPALGSAHPTERPSVGNHGLSGFQVLPHAPHARFTRKKSLCNLFQRVADSGKAASFASCPDKRHMCLQRSACAGPVGGCFLAKNVKHGRCMWCPCAPAPGPSTGCWTGGMRLHGPAPQARAAAHIPSNFFF